MTTWNAAHARSRRTRPKTDGKFFRKRRCGVKGCNVTWLGLDGAEGVEEATGGAVAFADLTFAMPPVARRPWVCHAVMRPGRALAMHMTRGDGGASLHAATEAPHGMRALVDEQMTAARPQP